MNRKKTLRGIIVVLALIILTAVTVPAVNTYAATRTPVFSKKTVSIKTGKKKTLKIKNLPKGSKVTWKSSKKKVATVSKKGRITPKKAGKTTITAKVKAGSRSYTLKCKVTVKWGGSVILGSLTSNVSGVVAGESENGLFYINVSTKNTKIGNKDVVLYCDGKVSVYMNDKGKNGDVTAGDGIYTGSKTLSSDAAKTEKYQVKCHGKKSDVLDLKYFAKPDAQTMEQENSAVSEIESIDSSFQDSDGKIPASQAGAASESVYQKALEMQSTGEVSDVRKNDNGNVVITFSSGEQYMYIPPVVGMDASGDDISVSVATLQPFRTWYESAGDYYGRLDDEGTDGSAESIVSNIPKYSFQTNLDDSEVTLDSIKGFGAGEVILWHGHGGYDVYAGSVLCTGESYDSWRAESDNEYHSDLVTGRTFRTSIGMAFSGTFVDKYVGNMNGSFIYAAACESGADGRLAKSFLNKGAVAYVGNNISIYSDYNSRMERDTVTGLLQVKDDGSYTTLAEALQYAMDQNGSDDGQGAYPMIFGNGEYTLSNENEGYVNGVIKSAETKEVMPSVGVSLYQGDKLVSSGTSDDSGNFYLKVKSGTYTLSISADGYQTFKDTVEVVTNRNTMVQNIYLVREGEEDTVTGVIRSSADAKTVEGVSISFYQNWDAIVTDSIGAVNTAVTDANGRYTVKLPAGYYTAQMSKDGYISKSFNVTSSPSLTEDQNSIITPVNGNQSYVVTLEWGNNPGRNPRDIDAHVTGTLSSDLEDFHMYWRDMTITDNEKTVAHLDVDRRRSDHGVETVTITPEQDMTYTYYVHKYAGRGSLSGSTAIVTLYKPDGTSQTWNVPVTGDDPDWKVFTLRNGIIDDSSSRTLSDYDLDDTSEEYEDATVTNDKWEDSWNYDSDPDDTYSDDGYNDDYSDYDY